jgi:hypothetical protein
VDQGFASSWIIYFIVSNGNQNPKHEASLIQLLGNYRCIPFGLHPHLHLTHSHHQSHLCHYPANRLSRPSSDFCIRKKTEETIYKCEQGHILFERHNCDILTNMFADQLEKKRKDIRSRRTHPIWELWVSWTKHMQTFVAMHISMAVRNATTTLMSSRFRHIMGVLICLLAMILLPVQQELHQNRLCSFCPCPNSTVFKSLICIETILKEI